MLPEQPSDPVTSNPPDSVASEKIVRISRVRLLLLLVALSIIIGGIIGAVGITVNNQNLMHTLATATASEATAQTITCATDAADAATAQAMNDPTGETAIPYPSYLPGKGTVALVDPLNQPDSYWGNYSIGSFGGAAQFTQGAYHVSEPLIDRFYSSDASGCFSNFAFEVQMTIISGDCGGIAFRHNAEAKSGYFFSVCQDGSYALGLYRDSGKNPQTLANSSSTAIHTGYNQSNVIAVAANGSSIGLYVNDQQIGNVNDTAYSSGVIALCANAPYGSTEVAYSNARLWTL